MDKCKEYNWLFWQWASCAPEMQSVKEGWKNKLQEHQVSCQVCKARMGEMNELARNAEYPEVKDE
jgi:hypothetical protein